MATRLYLPSVTGGTGISPAPATEWDNTASMSRVVPTLNPDGSPNTATGFQAGDATLTSNRDVLIVQLVFPLAAGTAFATTQTIKGRVLAREQTATFNCRSQFIARVIAADGTTVRATLYGGDLATLTGDPPSEWAAGTITNRQMPRGASVPIAVNYTIVPGDHLVLELGYRKHAAVDTTTGASLPRIQYASDPTDGDLPEDETTISGPNNNSWIEFSATFFLATNPFVRDQKQNALYRM